MPKAKVTRELSDTLKSIRLNNRIQAQSVAKHINKSPAYISKLENNEIKSIDTDELSDILHFITNEPSGSKSVEQIYKSLHVRLTNEEIEKQVWFTNFDTMIRQIPIPSELVDYTNNLLAASKISRSYLLNRINANEALTEREKEELLPDYNQWFYIEENESSFKSSIKIKLSLSELNNILDKRTDMSSYMFLFCILFYTKKIILYKDLISLNNDQYLSLYDDTLKDLNSFKFFSISAKSRLLENSDIKSDSDMERILNSFDKENLKYIFEILSQFSFVSQYNIKLANSQLSKFATNLNWDLGFMLKLMSMNFSMLKETSVSNKKELLKEINNLLHKYNELPSTQNIIENY